MRTQFQAFAIAALFGPLAVAQKAAEQSVDRVLYFAHIEDRQGIQEITNAIRALSEIPAVPDMVQHTLSLHGTLREVELAEWVFQELDQPAGGQAPTQSECRLGPL